MSPDPSSFLILVICLKPKPWPYLPLKLQFFKCVICRYHELCCNEEEWGMMKPAVTITEKSHCIASNKSKPQRAYNYPAQRRCLQNRFLCDIFQPCLLVD
mmetsp:Transcript_1698/g.2422  ORF Transcript_1698/g.2422 Transcript_1698/m.2422 type:complete len:100 (+) Transcript_1698:892-1191(+)